VEPLKAQVAMLTEALNEATDAIDAVESEPGRVGGPIFRIDWTRALKLVRDADPAAFILRKQTEAIDEFMQGAEAGLVKRMVSHGPGDDIIGRAVAARDTRVRAAAFASAALEIRASIACAGRDGDPLDADWVEACAETFEGYADGDAAPDDERCRRLLAECATQGVKT
jgi:hypothetical protein